MVIKRELCMVNCMDLIINFTCYETALDFELRPCESLVTTSRVCLSLMVESTELDLVFGYWLIN